VSKGFSDVSIFTFGLYLSHKLRDKVRDMKRVFDDPDENMEMPCQCTCGQWFDLNDGCKDLDNDRNVICSDCAGVQEESKQKEEDIQDLLDTISDAQITIRDSKAELQRLAPKKYAETSTPSLQSFIARARELGIYDIKSFKEKNGLTTLYNEFVSPTK